MNYYSHSDSLIRIAHFPGHTRQDNIEFIKEIREQTIVKADNVDIVSIITRDSIDNSCLHYQLNKSDINYINPVINKNIMWQNSKKIPYILEGLKQSNKEYCLIVDGADVVFTSDLIGLEQILESYNKDIIFNATIWMHPPILIDDVKNRERYGEYNYLNAGCCFGKRKALIEFYEECLQEYEKDKIRGASLIHDWTNSEQYYVRKVFDRHQDTVFFDYACLAFQVWHKAEMTFDDNGDCHLR